VCSLRDGRLEPLDPEGFLHDAAFHGGRNDRARVFDHAAAVEKGVRGGHVEVRGVAGENETGGDADGLDGFRDEAPACHRFDVDAATLEAADVALDVPTEPIDGANVFKRRR